MKTTILAGIGLTLMGASALAADLPSRTNKPIAPPVAAPMFNWSGLYAGLNAGYAWSTGSAAHFRGDALTFAAIGAGQVPGGYPSESKGFIGGGQIGYNHQIGNFVFGGETDIQYLGAKKTDNFLGTGGVLSSFRTEQSYLGTLRARFGFTPTERLLVYGTGGLAYGDVKNSLSISNPATGALWGGTKDELRWGWTLGAGAEYAFTNNLTAKAEYLYYDLGKGTSFGTALNAAAVTINPGASIIRKENTGNLVRVGLNYKF